MGARWSGMGARWGRDGSEAKASTQNQCGGWDFLGGGVYDFDAFWGWGRCNFAVDGDDYEG